MAGAAAVAIPAIAGIMGDIMSSQGQQDTNEQNATQAQLNRDFQAGMLTRVEQYDTEMSNTAMQRRVADLNAAGLNPMLAIGQGGASTPTVSAPTGAQAQMQNPDIAFSNLGGQVSSAMTAAAQARNLDAQTNLTNIEAQNKDPTFTYTDAGGNKYAPGQVSYQIGVNTAQSIDRQRALMTQEAENMAYTLDNILPKEASGLQVSVDQATRVMPYAIKAAQMNAKMLELGVPAAQAQSNMYSGPLGQYMPYLDKALQAVGVAAGVMGLGKMIGSMGRSSAPSSVLPGGLNPSGSDRMGNIDDYLSGR